MYNLTRIGPLPTTAAYLVGCALNVRTVEGEDEIDNMSLRICVGYTGVK